MEKKRTSFFDTFAQRKPQGIATLFRRGLKTQLPKADTKIHSKATEKKRISFFDVGSNRASAEGRYQDSLESRKE